MKTETEQKILEALVALDQAVDQMRLPGPKPNLLPLFSRIEDLARELPAGSDPDLLHYLHKKSYQKARQLLEGKTPAPASGACQR
jgi:hypothetical protein